jgi:hypothetical protein
VRRTTPAELEPITDPEQARQFVIGQRALRRSMLMSIALDLVIAVALIAFGLPVALVIPLAIAIVGISAFSLSRIQKAGDLRLAHFRDPVTGRIEVPGA